MMAPTNYCDECGASNSLQATYCFACNSTLQTSTPSPLLDVQVASTKAAVFTGRATGPLIPSYLLHSRYSIVSQVGRYRGLRGRLPGERYAFQPSPGSD